MAVRLSKTEAMLDTLIAMGHLVGIDMIRIAAKKIPHQRKMVLLRFFNDWQTTGDKHYEDKFLDYWQPIRKYLEKELDK